MPTYDIAISFAGEDRPVAERLASFLVTRGLNIFYDEYQQANLWGKDLYVHLSKIYKDEAKYCLMLVYRKVPEEKIVDAVVLKVHEYNNVHGIAYELVKVEDVFAKQAIGPKGGRPIKDRDMRTTCPACGTAQLLSGAVLSLNDSETIYTCKHGCQPLVVVGRPGVVAWPGRGYRLGDHVVRNVRDIIVKTEDMGTALLLNARDAALIKRRPVG